MVGGEGGGEKMKRTSVQSPNELSYLSASV